jgi:hypothetical protein
LLRPDVAATIGICGYVGIAFTPIKPEKGTRSSFLGLQLSAPVWSRAITTGTLGRKDFAPCFAIY